MAPGVELADYSWPAIGIGFVVAVILGFVWYAPKMPTGRIWMRENKFDPNQKPTGGQMAKGIILMVIGTAFMTIILMHVFIAVRDAFRLDAERMDSAGLSMVDGLTGGFFVWLGFFLPQNFSSVGWEMKSWSLFFVNTSYHLVNLLAIGAVYAAFV